MKKATWTSQCATVHRHFCPKIMFNFSLHFGDKTFWWVRGENTWVLLFIFLPLHLTKHTPKSFLLYFLSKVFHLFHFTSKQTHRYSFKKCMLPFIIIYFNDMGPFGNIVLVILFFLKKIYVGEKVCKNTCNII